MNEREKEIFVSMADCLDDLPERKKGEFIGYAKCMADMKRKKDAPAAGERSRETG